MFDAVFMCSVALLRGLEIRYGRHSARLRRGQLAYDEAVRFVEKVSEGRAMIAAHEALNPRPKKEKKGRIKWL